MKIKVQDKEITIKTNNCSINGSSCFPKNKEDLFVDISFVLGNVCNAKCDFCCGEKFYFEYYNWKIWENVILQIMQQDISIRKITFTGGEPSLYISLINFASKIANNLDENIKIVVNTNGTNNDMLLKYLNPKFSIAYSRHHHSDVINDYIFKTKTDSFKNIEILKNQFEYLNLVCVTQKGFIDNAQEFEEYLEYCAKYNISNVALLSMIPVNNYCKENYINPLDFKFSNNVLNYKNQCYEEPNICSCHNFVYSSNEGKLVYFYIRNNMNYSYNKNSFLIFKNNQIYGGFNG